MAVTQAQIDALERAYFSGVLKVSFDGVETSYRSSKELKEALSDARAQFAAQQTGGSVAPMFMPVTFTRG